MAGARRPAARGADRASRRHQCRHRSPAGPGQAGFSGGQQPGLVLAAGSARRRRHDRFLPRARHRALGLRHARRRFSDRSLGRGIAARGDRRLEQAEIPALRGGARRLGRAADAARGAGRDRAQARRFGRQCRDALGAGAAGGARDHRRRQARRARASRRQSAPVRLRARCRRPRADRAGAGGRTADPGRLRRRVPAAAVPHRIGRSAPSSRGLRQGLAGARRSRPARSVCGSTAAAAGNSLPATAARCASATASW